MMITPRLSWCKLALLAVFSLSPALLAEGIFDDLTPAQVAQIKKGEQVLITQKVEGLAWPRVKVYRTVKATPEEVAAVFVDYKNAKSFVPNLLKSEISKQISPTVAEVDYTLDIPILPDEFYTVRNTLTTQSGGGYLVKWKLVRAAQTKDTEGSIDIQPYGDISGICYQNLVTPGSGMAGLLKGKAISQMEETVESIAAQVEKQKNSNPAALQGEVQALRAALGGQ